MTWLSLIIEAISLPDISRGGWRYAQRGWITFSGKPVANLLATLAEPIVTFVVVGYGLGHWMGAIAGQPYATYFLPAAVALAGMWIPFVEASSAVLLRTSSQDCYWAAMQAPVDAKDIIHGEVLWAAVKGTLAGVVTMIFGAAAGISISHLWWSAVLLLFLLCILFAALGAFSAVTFGSSRALIIIQGLILTPLALLSDTLFPLSSMGAVGHWAALISPLTHGVHALRTMFTGQVSSQIFLNLGVIFLLAVIFVNLTVVQFRRRFSIS